KNSDRPPSDDGVRCRYSSWPRQPSRPAVAGRPRRAAPVPRPDRRRHGPPRPVAPLLGRR
ncbi:hypothetical protein HK405_015771, partial [Cladochytrium tenue]